MVVGDPTVSLTGVSAPSWTTIAPVAALAALAVSWGRGVPGTVLALDAVLLGVAVLAAVHHAEVIAHRVGEPFGSLVLAVAVTVIEVGLIITLMSGGGAQAQTLARDTVFAAVMITVNGIAGVSLLVAAHRGRDRLAYFNAEGSGAALAAVFAVTTLTLVLPTVTVSAPDGRYTGGQLAFAAVAALAVWLLFVFTQTLRHRDFFLPVNSRGDVLDDEHADPPTTRATLSSLALLVVALVSVVGLAKVESVAIESAVTAAGLPQSFVGVVIALLVLAPESLAAVNNARRRRVQVSLNLAYGSAMASIGLTIPCLAVAVAAFDLPLVLGLSPLHIALLAVTAVVGMLTVVPGRATRLSGAIHLVLAAAYVFLAAVP